MFLSVTIDHYSSPFPSPLPPLFCPLPSSLPPLPSPSLPSHYTAPVAVSSEVKDTTHGVNISIHWKVIQYIMQHYSVFCKHTQLVTPRVTRDVDEF